MQYRISYGRGGSFWLGPIGLLLITNVVIFIAAFIQRDILELLSLKPFFFTLEPWTLLTSMFVHASLWHILFNMFALYFFGSYCMNLIGKVPFIFVYFLGGIASGLLVLLLSDPNPFLRVYGASGAIFALAGVCVAMRPKTTVFIFPIPVPIPLWVAILIFVAFSFLPGISWEGHLGGLIFGVIVGLFYRLRRRRISFEF